MHVPTALLALSARGLESVNNTQVSLLTVSTGVGGHQTLWHVVSIQQ